MNKRQKIIAEHGLREAIDHTNIQLVDEGGPIKLAELLQLYIDRLPEKTKEQDRFLEKGLITYGLDFYEFVTDDDYFGAPSLGIQKAREKLHNMLNSIPPKTWLGKSSKNPTVDITIDLKSLLESLE
jgi:hypothetical protein